MVTTTIVKGPKGLGFTLIGNDASSKGNEFIQVRSEFFFVVLWLVHLEDEVRYGRENVMGLE